jgi:26S proteasome regulatory subunit N2
MLRYALEVSMDLVLHREFRQTVLRLLVKLYNQHPVKDQFNKSQPDYLKISEISIHLDDPKMVSDILHQLVQSRDNDNILLAYQIGFDLVNSATQHFLESVRSGLPNLEPDNNNNANTSSTTTTTASTTATTTSTTTPAATGTGSDSMEVESQVPKDPYVEGVSTLKKILSGETTISLYLDFLFRNNKTDLLILKNIKTTLETRSSVLHTATLFTNALMHCGTTSDTFLRDNLEWLSRATNWAKFSAIAGLGVIHKGHLKEGLTLLAPYLPQPGVSGSAYSEGGSLYALGLIHANHGGSETVQYLTRALNNASGNDIVQHGACLGLGLAAMATGNDAVYEDLKGVLFLDSAVAGEAAGLAMGLVMLGTASQKAIEEMIGYAHETQHEKIIRGLAIGIGAVMYGREEEADTLIEQLLLDKDPILRFGAMYTIGLAYAGTANNSAIRKLLHVAVSDVSDDVRRAAVTCLGFLLLKVPEQCPRVVSLLAESYNPHVRYGACLALGISCAGSGLKEAVDLLEPLTSDPVDFVRQGALIAMAMILMQTSKAQQEKVEKIRKLLDEKIADKHEDVMCKFGAVLAYGIIDAGGRNVTISLTSRTGHNNLSAIIGLAVFTQFWYWYPLTYFVSLAFTPTAFIGLNKKLQMPVFSFKSNARPSLFAYPPVTTPPTTKAPEKVHTAVLSVTRKKEIRDKKAESKKMEVEKPSSVSSPAATTATTSGTTTTVPSTTTAGTTPGTATTTAETGEKKEGAAGTEEKKEEKKPEPEPESEVKQNPARVTLQQAKYLSFDIDERYKPIKTTPGEVFGIVMLKDLKPDAPEELVTPAALAGTKAEEENEPEPPEAFIFDPTKE